MTGPSSPLVHKLCPDNGRWPANGRGATPTRGRCGEERVSGRISAAGKEVARLICNPAKRKKRRFDLGHHSSIN
ncbi:MAG: hypothetical protein Q8P67_25020 [archaeon]|nr:hypothetical protein [archaeon]